MKFVKTFDQYIAEAKNVTVFDFDDTLGVSKNVQQVMRFVDGKPISNIKEELLKLGLKHTEIVDVWPSKKHPGGKIACLSTEGFREYVYLMNKQGIVVHMGADSELIGKGVEDVVDFSDASHVNLNTTRPVKRMIDVAKDAEKQGEDLKIVTGRKVDTPIASLEKGKIEPTNARDISNFLKKQGVKSVDSEDVYGAADINPQNIPASKAEIIADKIVKKDTEEIEFYDDDKRNVEAVEKLNEPGKLPVVKSKRINRKVVLKNK
jgi:hypothetical protein